MDVKVVVMVILTLFVAVAAHKREIFPVVVVMVFVLVRVVAWDVAQIKGTEGLTPRIGSEYREIIVVVKQYIQLHTR